MGLRQPFAERRNPVALRSTVHDANPEERHGEVRQEGAVEGQEGDGRAQGRHAAERPLGQEGDEPQAGDRHRPVGSAARRRQGAFESEPIEEIVEPQIEEVGTAEVREEIRNEEVVVEEIDGEAFGDEEVVGAQIGIEALGHQEIGIEEKTREEVAKVVVKEVVAPIRRVAQPLRRRLQARPHDRVAGARAAADSPAGDAA